MSKVPVEVAVREHVMQRELSEAQLQALEALPRTPLLRTRAPWGTRRSRVLLVAAAMVLVVAGGFILRPGEDAAPITQQIATEVAKNHVKLKPLEVASDDMADIRSFFVELDFVPVESAAMTQSDFELMGGRYCSIAGDEAAQLRVRQRASGQVGSLYMAPYDAEKHGAIPRRSEGEPPLVMYARGLKVEIWVEQDLLMAMTGPF